MSSNDYIHISINRSIFSTVALCLYVVYSIARRMFSYIVLWHYLVTNSNGMQLKV